MASPSFAQAWDGPGKPILLEVSIQTAVQLYILFESLSNFEIQAMCSRNDITCAREWAWIRLCKHIRAQVIRTWLSPWIIRIYIEIIPHVGVHGEDWFIASTFSYHISPYRCQPRLASTQLQWTPVTTKQWALCRPITSCSYRYSLGNLS